MSLAAAERLAFGTTGTVRNWKRPDKNVLPRMDTLESLAPVLQTTAQWLMYGDDAVKTSSPANGLREATPPLLPSRSSMPMDVPVLGTAAGSHVGGAFEFEGGVVDYVRRPPALTGRDIFALYVEGSSMEPQYFPGDLIYVNPHKPPRAGEIVVVQMKQQDHSPIEATLGIYRRMTEKHLVLGKRNPAADIEIERGQIASIQKVMTMNELFGV